LLRRLITVEKALSLNTKIVVPANTELVNIIGDMAGILPLGRSTPPERPLRTVPKSTDPSDRPFKGNGQ
jgi:hypothetical protein